MIDVNGNVGETFDTTAYPFGITAGPDGNMWFCIGFGNAIGRINLASATASTTASATSAAASAATSAAAAASSAAAAASASAAASTTATATATSAAAATATATAPPPPPPRALPRPARDRPPARPGEDEDPPRELQRRADHEAARRTQARPRDRAEPEARRRQAPRLPGPARRRPPLATLSLLSEGQPLLGDRVAGRVAASTPGDRRQEVLAVELARIELESTVAVTVAVRGTSRSNAISPK